MADPQILPAPGAAPSVAAPIKRGGIYNYILKNGAIVNQKKVDLDTTAFVIGVVQKSRVKRDKDQNIVTETVKVNTTKGPATVTRNVYETYPVYDIVIFSAQWMDSKFISGVEASALIAL